MDVNRRCRVALGVIAAVAFAAALQTPVALAAPLPTVLTDAQIAAMSPVAQAQYLDPLRAVAAALSASGRGDVGIFSQVVLDPNRHQVDLYVTDPARAAPMIMAAGESGAAVDARGGIVQVRKAAHTIQELDAARSVYLSEDHPFETYAIGPALGGSGLDVEVANPQLAAKQSSGVRVGVKITFVHGFRRVFKIYDTSAERLGTSQSPGQPVGPGWAAVKWHDSTPFIGGDVITPDGRRYCTAGLPAVRPSDHHPIMITAAHCFSVGQHLFTGGGPTWSWGNGHTGNFVGVVTGRIQQWDAETLDGADNNADESDTAGWKPLTSAAYSYVGDFVCHSGARSAYLGHGTPCGIKVTNQDLWFSIGGYSTRGVEGVDVNGWGSVNGDSGGTVFARTDASNNRQARGMVSAGGTDGTPDQKRVDWPEAPDILRADKLQLNPIT